MTGHQVIATILRHDAKVTSYKIALLRAINDVVLAFPDLAQQEQDVAVPLRMLAENWIAYFWPFAGEKPIYQGALSKRGDSTSNDMAFRPALAELRRQWELVIGGASRPADGFFLVNEMRVGRKRTSYPPALLVAYQAALRAIATTLQMPIRYAGRGQWSVFPRPAAFDPTDSAIAVPGTRDGELCLRLEAGLWATFVEMSLWVEALCIHEWCLFTEGVEQPADSSVDRGLVYLLLTDRPDNRRPLTWERNKIDLLVLEGAVFVCPWTGKQISRNIAYALDHLIPVSIYPINELWNLAPANPHYNSHVKRDRLPSKTRIEQAVPRLVTTYQHYETSEPLAAALQEDARGRFSLFKAQAVTSTLLTQAVASYMAAVTASRNLATF